MYSVMEHFVLMSKHRLTSRVQGEKEVALEMGQSSSNLYSPTRDFGICMAWKATKILKLRYHVSYVVGRVEMRRKQIFDCINQHSLYVCMYIHSWRGKPWHFIAVKTGHDRRTGYNDHGSYCVTKCIREESCQHRYQSESKMIGKVKEWISSKSHESIRRVCMYRKKERDGSTRLNWELQHQNAHR